MIVYIQKFFRFVHFCGSFPIKTNENVFLKNKHLHMHSSTQISHADIIFDADSEFNLRFPRLWLFTFSRNKVWNQPLICKIKHRESFSFLGLIYLIIHKLHKRRYFLRKQLCKSWVASSFISKITSSVQIFVENRGCSLVYLWSLCYNEGM